MPEYVMVCWALADGRPAPEAGQFLRSYDLESPGPLGWGVIRWTPDLEEAIRFASPSEAMGVWKATSLTRPVRPWDGRPNRPLTAYSIDVMSVEDVRAGKVDRLYRDHFG